jgi:O-antigen/teichoic acid export membrane protein
VTSRPLARDLLWALLAYGLPLVAGVFAIPALVHQLGIERFGLVSLAWMFVAYFSLLDLGIGRALARRLSARDEAASEHGFGGAVGAGLAILVVLATLSAILACAISPWLTHSVLRVPPTLETEAFHLFLLLSASLLVVIPAAGLEGVLQALQRFDAMAAVRIPLGLWTFLGPLLAAGIYPNLAAVGIAILAGRVVAAIVALALAHRALGARGLRASVDLAQLKPLLAFGGWVTVSSIVGPLMVYLDRFVIGAFLSLDAVAFYAAPYDVITRLGFIGQAVGTVLLPKLAAAGPGRPVDAARLIGLGTGSVIGLLFPIVFAAVLLAAPALELWLGTRFAHESSRVLQILAVGVLLNGVAQVPFAALHAAGHSRWTATLHLIEMPLYFAMLSVALSNWGIEGAALAWTLRAAVDAAALFALSARAQRLRPGLLGAIALALTGAVAILGLAMAARTQGLQVAIAIATGLALAAVALVLRERLVRWAKGPP